MRRSSLIEQEAGKALDPRAVEAFLRILPRVRVEAEAAAKPPVPRQVSDAGRSAAPRPRRRERTVFDDIAVAHGEIYALYEIAQTMGTSLGVSDTMALHRVEADRAWCRSRRARCSSTPRTTDTLQLPVRDRHRLRADAAAGAEERAGADRAGSRATGVRS